MRWQTYFHQLNPNQSVIPADLPINLPQAVLRAVGWDTQPTTPVPARHLQRLAQGWKGRRGRPPSPVPHTSVLISLPAGTRARLHGHARNLGWKPSSLLHHLALSGRGLDPMPAVNRIAQLHLQDQQRRAPTFPQRQKLEAQIERLSRPTTAPIWPHQRSRAMRLCLRPDQIRALGLPRAKIVARRIDKVLITLPYIPALSPLALEQILQGHEA